ncbi:LLM class F420-dependent oxidoreductase [Streptomyces spiroverticillatus]|uniref:LLM class F420-dependent oxidoreductase n=1 Tax=Streptomyces finlayi TaxID=67296 RepID=A0A918WRV4_9ACTN|nr:TIGR03619 family F420-dependent LLM class oxidoreductase [Streptomyces finlayi]GGZ84729.1 LLM class F420-dependent oxidoreductase [Streptomyces spiroverticillatus]GHC76483.1 LLM class F420-dependent oxidoreductase [Streptomyces finlayi]
MDIGITLPQYGTHARADLIASYAREAEEIGFDSLWVGDRALTPVEPSDVYPGYTAENPYPEGFKHFVDPFVALSVAASATTRVRLGTSTLNAPWYPPLLLARSLTSLDLLSGGRLDPGFGIGWMRDEYTAVNADFTQRGAQLDEILDFLDAIWSSTPFSHTGKTWQVPLSYVDLRPVQPGGPPVYLGGFGPAAMRRVGRRAAGWVGVAMPDAGHTALWGIARRAAEDAGRDPDALRQQIRVNVAPGQSAEDVAAILRSVRGWGAEGAFVELQQRVREPAEALELGSRVRDLVRAG